VKVPTSQPPALKQSDVINSMRALPHPNNNEFDAPRDVRLTVLRVGFGNGRGRHPGCRPLSSPPRCTLERMQPDRHLTVYSTFAFTILMDTTSTWIHHVHFLVESTPTTFFTYESYPSHSGCLVGVTMDAQPSRPCRATREAASEPFATTWEDCE